MVLRLEVRLLLEKMTHSGVFVDQYQQSAHIVALRVPFNIHLPHRSNLVPREDHTTQRQPRTGDLLDEFLNVKALNQVANFVAPFVATSSEQNMTGLDMRRHFI